MPEHEIESFEVMIEGDEKATAVGAVRLILKKGPPGGVLLTNIKTISELAAVASVMRSAKQCVLDNEKRVICRF